MRTKYRSTVIPSKSRGWRNKNRFFNAHATIIMIIMRVLLGRRNATHYAARNSNVGSAKDAREMTVPISISETPCYVSLTHCWLSAVYWLFASRRHTCRLTNVTIPFFFFENMMNFLLIPMRRCRKARVEEAAYGLLKWLRMCIVLMFTTTTTTN